MHQTTDLAAEPIEPQSELIDIEYLATRLGCSTRHVRRLAAIGRIPRSIKLGALLRWLKTDIDQWMAAGCPHCGKKAIRRSQ
jgi:excisionase family DNA binding protein